MLYDECQPNVTHQFYLVWRLTDITNHDINNRSQIRFHGQRHYSAVVRSDVTKATARPENIPRSVFERRVYVPFNISNAIKLARRLSYLVSSWRRMSDKWDSRPIIVFIYHSSRVHHTIDAICCDVISKMASGSDSHRKKLCTSRFLGDYLNRIPLRTGSPLSEKINDPINILRVHFSQKELATIDNSHWRRSRSADRRSRP